MLLKPMLAARIKDTASLMYPLIASPKIDGIRCLRVEDRVLSRALKLIPNEYTRGVLERLTPDGCDGELTVGQTFHESTSGIMSRDGQPNFTYHVFDFVDVPGRDMLRPYVLRLRDLHAWWERAKQLVSGYVRIVPTVEIASEAALLAFERQCLEDGYEGVMTRAPDGPYKNGRSTAKEQWLLKLKRFADGEAEVIGFVEQQHNLNPQMVNELGRSKRSSAQCGKVAAGTLGALKVRDCKTKVEFEVGTGVGLTQALRQAIWADRPGYLGQLVKYRSQTYGTKDKPRSPIWLGFRDRRDL